MVDILLLVLASLIWFSATVLIARSLSATIGGPR